MNPNPRTTPDARAPRRVAPTVSAVLPSGALVEMLYRPDERRTGFAVWEGDRWHVTASIPLDDATRLVPYSAENNLIKNEVVLLPSEPEAYGTEEELVAEIRAFLHRYVDLSPLFEEVAAFYVLLTWVYDRFNEVPYLRFRGDPGTGKTRALLTVGSLCYKPIFASGASTVSPLFRMLDAFRGTLVVDEGDFRVSDERAEVVKILNNGNARGFPVLRSEVSPNGREFNPRAYHVFGPKLVATRGYFEDRALESRFLTEELGDRGLREDIAISLPPEHKTEALRLRNKLLMFRFRNRHKTAVAEGVVDRTIEPRLNQIFAPLLSVIEDRKARDQLRELARQYNRELVTERGMDLEAHILEVIRDLRAFQGEGPITIKAVTDWLAERHGAEYERKLTPKWIGGVIRRKLHLGTRKIGGSYVLLPSEAPKLTRLYEKYGVGLQDKPEEPEAVVVA